MATAPTTPPTVDPLPTAPSRSSPSLFRVLMDAFLASMVTFETQLNTFRTWMNTTAGQVFDNAGEAAASATTATTKAGEASDSADAAAASETQAALSAAAAGAASPVDVSAQNFGDLLQVVDDGAGGKELAMSAQRLENSASFTGTTPSLDIAADQYHHGTLTGNTTFTFDVSGFGAISGNAIFFVLEITQDSTLRTITFPASVDWDDGTAPDTPAINTKSVYTFATRDGGTTWLGVQSGTAFG
jgi:hypothetical protein